MYKYIQNSMKLQGTYATESMRSGTLLLLPQLLLF